MVERLVMKCIVCGQEVISYTIHDCLGVESIAFPIRPDSPLGQILSNDLNAHLGAVAE